jgi:hypothetical protein
MRRIPLSTKTALTTGFFLFMAGAVAFAQPVDQKPAAGGDVELALDRKLEKLAISNKEIPAALDEIGEKGGVKIAVDDAAAELLPWGKQTKIAGATISDASLREVLPQILNPLGMTYVVEGGRIHVVATEPLKRINRRATWEDLKLLRLCCETPYTPEEFAKLKLQYRVTAKVDAPKMLQRQLERAGRGSIAQMLETACNSLGWAWLPDNEEIVIRTHEAQIANQLSRRVTIRYTNTPLAKVLTDLANKADVGIFFEPGVMLKLPRPTAESYTLLLDQSSIRQAFELIAAETGLAYEIRRDGINIAISETLAGGAARSSTRRSPYVAKVSIPSKDGSYTLDFLLSGDELPPDILEYRDQMIEQYVERMRVDLEGSTEKSMEDEAKPAEPKNP